MIQNKYSVIGVMSGTSLDGVDLVLVNFYKDKNWSFELIQTETIAYSKKWYDVLKTLVCFSLKELKDIDNDYTKYLSSVIKHFMQKHQIRHIDAVCSHGHTALHQPENRLTYQIGNKPLMAKELGEKVICDFRVQDVDYGGQGAPLVPVGDKLLFSEYDFCLNLGGFANISMGFDGDQIAYDICPVNIVLNAYVNRLGLPYDDGGKIAESGNLNSKLLSKLNDLEFYREKHPKSLGLEWVNTNIFPIMESFEIDLKDKLRTFIEHISIQITSQFNKKVKATVLVTGGGVYNSFLLERIKFYSQSTVVVPSNDIIQFKEALIFGFLGVLKLRNEVNCLKSVTGASKDHSSGKIFFP